MAGDPGFTRAKRFRFYHTSHETLFDGSEAVTVTTDLTETISGAHTQTITGNQKVSAANASLDAPHDLMNNPLYNVRGGNVGHSRKETIMFGDLTATAVYQEHCMFNAKAGDTMHDVFANVASPFAFGSSASMIKVCVGIKTSPSGFAVTHLCGPADAGYIMTGQTGAEKGSLLRTASGRMPYIFTAAASVIARFSSSGDQCYVASLDKGQIDVFFNMTQAQA